MNIKHLNHEAADRQILRQCASFSFVLDGVEEGLVNALIHRSYLELGSEVHIDMYDNRMEIYSPGGLMDGGSINDMDVMNMMATPKAWNRYSQLLGTVLSWYCLSSILMV